MGLSTLNIIKRARASNKARDLAYRLVEHLRACLGEGISSTIIGTQDGGAMTTLTVHGDLKLSIEVTRDGRARVLLKDKSIEANTQDPEWKDRICQFVKATLEELDRLAKAEDTLYLVTSKIDPGRYAPYLQPNTGFTKDRFLILTDRFGNLRVEAFIKCPPAIRIVAKVPEYKEFFLKLLGNDFKVEDRGRELLVSACDTETGLVSAEKLDDFIQRLKGRLKELAGLVKRHDTAYRY